MILRDSWLRVSAFFAIGEERRFWTTRKKENMAKHVSVFIRNVEGAKRGRKGSFLSRLEVVVKIPGTSCYVLTEAR